MLRSTSVGGICAAVALAAGAPTAAAGVIVFASDRCPAASQGPAGEASRDDNPSWSPDGRSILYKRAIAMYDRWRVSLWIVSTDGTTKSQVGPEAPNSIIDFYEQPEWSPDGRWVVFTASRGDVPPGPPGYAIWLMSGDSGEIKRLTDGLSFDHSPTFSPDGTRIAFVRVRPGPDRRAESALLSMDLDGGGVAPVLVGTPPDPRPMAPASTLRPAWSPDGRQFALAFREDLYTVDSDGTNLELRGHTGPPIGIGAPFAEPHWTAEPAPALIFDLPMEGRPLQRLELTGPPAAARDLTPPVTDPARPYVEGDLHPDWRPSVPVPPAPDLEPPVVLPIDRGDAAVPASSARRRLSVRRRALGFMAFDPGGVRRVEVSIRRRLHARPVWRRVRGAAHFGRVVRRLSPGRYRLRMRAVDGLGNRTARAPVVRLRLRR